MLKKKTIVKEWYITERAWEKKIQVAYFIFLFYISAPSGTVMCLHKQMSAQTLL